MKKFFFITLAIFLILPITSVDAGCTYTYKNGRTSPLNNDDNWVKADCTTGNQRVIKEAPNGYEASIWDTSREVYYTCEGDACSKTREVVDEDGWYNTYLCSNGVCKFEEGYYYDRPTETTFKKSKDGTLKSYDGNKWFYYDSEGEITGIKDNNDKNSIAVCKDGNCKRTGGTFSQEGVEYVIENDIIIKGYDGVNWYYYDRSGNLSEVKDIQDRKVIVSCNKGACAAKNFKGRDRFAYTCNGSICKYDNGSGSFAFDYIRYLKKISEANLAVAPEIPDLTLEIPHVTTIPKGLWCSEGCSSCNEERECLKCKKGYIKNGIVCNRIRYTKKEAAEATNDTGNSFLVRYK